MVLQFLLGVRLECLLARKPCLLVELLDWSPERDVGDKRPCTLVDGVHDFPGPLDMGTAGLHAKLGESNCDRVPLDVGVKVPAELDGQRMHNHLIINLEMSDGGLENLQLCRLAFEGKSSCLDGVMDKKPKLRQDDLHDFDDHVLDRNFGFAVGEEHFLHPFLEALYLLLYLMLPVLAFVLVVDICGYGAEELGCHGRCLLTQLGKGHFGVAFAFLWRKSRIWLNVLVVDVEGYLCAALLQSYQRK